MKLFVDAFCGMSGDMFASALFSLGAFKGMNINSVFEEIFDNKVDVKFVDALNNGIKTTKMQVELAADAEFHLSHYGQIKQMINRLKISAVAKAKSIDILTNLGKAEAEIHGTSIDKIHFHEIGAYDTIIDIVLSAVGIENLMVTECIVSPINVGTGQIHIAHGNFSIPAPATLSLLEGYEIYSRGIGELTTPTGAAIIKTFFKTGRMCGKLFRSGTGGGNLISKETPDIIRLMLFDAESSGTLLIQANIDDMNPEILGDFVSRLLNMGSLDAWLEPIFMKKNRVGSKLCVLTTNEKKDMVIAAVLRETTTFGVRYFSVDRSVLDRHIEYIDYKGERIRIKNGYFSGKLIKSSPEFEDMRKLSIKTKIPLIDLYKEIAKKIDTNL